MVEKNHSEADPVLFVKSCKVLLRLYRTSNGSSEFTDDKFACKVHKRKLWWDQVGRAH